MEPQKSPVFIGQMASSYGGGGNTSLGSDAGAPQGHCPGAPSTLPTPPCGGRTNNCQAKGEAKRLADKPETVTCNVTEYELTCKWEPRIVPKTCTVMVPQYKAVCAGNKKIQATVQRTYQVDTRFDANQDGVIQQSEFEAARAAGGLQAMGNPTIVGGGGGGAVGAGGAGGAAGFSGQMGGGGAVGGGGGGYGGAANFGASGMQTGMQTGTGMASTFGASTGMQSNFNMGMGTGQVGGMQPMMGTQMGGGGGYGN